MYPYGYELFSTINEAPRRLDGIKSLALAFTCCARATSLDSLKQMLECKQACAIPILISAIHYDFLRLLYHPAQVISVSTKTIERYDEGAKHPEEARSFICTARRTEKAAQEGAITALFRSSKKNTIMKSILSFMDLPPELRQRVYELLFHRIEAIKFIDRGYPGGKSLNIEEHKADRADFHAVIIPLLYGSNKTIYQEATSTPYSMKLYYFEGIKIMGRLFKSIERQAIHIRQIQLASFAPDPRAHPGEKAIRLPSR